MTSLANLDVGVCPLQCGAVGDEWVSELPYRNHNLSANTYRLIFLGFHRAFQSLPPESSPILPHQVMGLKIWGAGWHARRGDSRSGNNYGDLPAGADGRWSLFGS